MRILIDSERCMGHGQCELAAPEVFRLDADGIVQVLIETPDESLRQKVEQAVRRCPETVIQLV